MRLKKLVFTMTLTAALMSGGIAAFAAATTDPNANGRAGRYERFVTDGVISQSTYEAIETYIKENRPQKDKSESGTDAGRTGKHDQMVTQLVSDGTITQTTADAISEYMNTQKETLQEKRQARDSETNDSDTSKERRTGMEDRWKTILDAGVITQTEYDAIIAALPERPTEDSAVSRTKMEEQLLSAGVITQTEYDAIISAMGTAKQ